MYIVYFYILAEISVIHRGTPAPHVIHEAVPTQPPPPPPSPPQPSPQPPQQLSHQTQFEPQRLVPQEHHI